MYMWVRARRGSRPGGRDALVLPVPFEPLLLYKVLGAAGIPCGFPMRLVAHVGQPRLIGVLGPF